MYAYPQRELFKRGVYCRGSTGAPLWGMYLVGLPVGKRGAIIESYVLYLLPMGTRGVLELHLGSLQRRKGLTRN